jgi:hypothetical protein
MMNEHEQVNPVTPRPATPAEVARLMPNRLVVIEQVYFQSGTHGPVVSECRFERKLSSDDSPYPPPRIKIEDGQHTNLNDARKAGWLLDEPVGLMHIVNEGPGMLLVGGTSGPFFRVRSGESFRAEPLNLSEIALRALGGSCTIKYTLFPA